MKTSVNFSQFCDAFRSMDRNENFSYDGKRALFDFIEDVTEQTGIEVELDVIALCCDYSEDDVETIIDNFRIDVREAEGDEEEIAEIVEKYLRNNTMVVSKLSNGSFVYAQF